MKPAVRVLVVDDYEPFRRFVCAALKCKPDFQVIGEAADGLHAVQKAVELQPDLILLDIGLPRLNGIEASRRMSRDVPTARILFVSQNRDADVIAEALTDGARGFIHKHRVKTDLMTAIEAVLRGDRFLSQGSGTADHAIPRP
jgi:DNA-binding NarL/FixJ family response regulator